MNFLKYTNTNGLLEAALGHRLYSFEQGDDWKNVRFGGGGVCTAISIDWIRRKTLKKKTFGNPKYAAGFPWNEPGRQKLGAKHRFLQDTFQSEKEKAIKANPKKGDLFDSEQRWAQPAIDSLALAYNTNPDRQARKTAKNSTESSGFEKLKAKVPGIVAGLDVVNKRQDVISFTLTKPDLPEDIQPWGVMITWNLGKAGTGVGHSVAIVRENNLWYFLDPNYGEYCFPDPPDEVVSFVTSLWRNQYDQYTSLYPMYLVASALNLRII
jgi:hypothetical protein